MVRVRKLVYLVYCLAIVVGGGGWGVILWVFLLCVLFFMGSYGCGFLWGLFVEG